MFLIRLSLLNTTVSQLAKAVNSVLTVCYRDIYDTGSNEEVGHLQLLTSPLAATDEVVGLYSNGLVPLEIAMPSVLHAIGATQEDIISAVEKAKQKQEEQENREKGEQENKEKDDKLNLQMKEADLRNRTSNADSQQNKGTDEKQ